MNADWAKGRNERTGQEGIFPRSYVNVVEDTNGLGAPAPPLVGSNYGNMPLVVSQGSGEVTGGSNSKVNEQGKKFGKKLGNAGRFFFTVFCIGMDRLLTIMNSYIRCGSYNRVKHCQRNLLG